MRFEHHSFVRDLVHVAQTHDLETAGISEDRTLPAHEVVEAAELFDQAASGAKGEVIGVGKDEFVAQILEVFAAESLDGSLGADGHEGGQFHSPMWGVEASPPGFGDRALREELVSDGH